ncbi:MAG: hypothetical protein AB8G11_26680 [Saprospiraceae bacterium]
MGKLKSALEDALKTLEGAAKDLSSIEVTTLTGDIKQVFNDDGNIDLKKALNDLNAGGSTSGKIEVVAHTRIDFDQDAIMFVSKNSRNKNHELYELHKEAIASSQAARQSFLRFIREFLGDNA